MTKAMNLQMFYDKAVVFVKIKLSLKTQKIMAKFIRIIILVTGILSFASCKNDAPKNFEVRHIDNNLKITNQSIAFYLDEGFKKVQTTKINNTYPFILQKGTLCIMLAAPELDKFPFSKSLKFWVDAGITDLLQTSKVLNSMDTLYFTALKQYKCIDKRKESFYQLGKDFSTKYYQNANEHKMITHTFYTKDYAYCFLFTYESADDANAIDQIIKGIDIIENPYKQSIVWASYSPWLGLFVLIFMYVGYKIGKRGVRKLSYKYVCTFVALFLLLLAGFMSGRTWNNLFAIAFVICAFSLYCVYYVVYYFGFTNRYNKKDFLDALGELDN